LIYYARIAVLVVVCLVGLLGGCASFGGGEGSGEPTTGPAPLKVGVAANAPPMVYKNGQGELQGLEVDFANRLGKALGRPVVFVPMDFEDLIGSVRSGEIDIIMAGMTITPAREQKVLFVTPYLKTGQCVMVRMEDKFNYYAPPSILQAKGWVGAESGTTGDSFARRYMTNASVWGYSSLAKAGEALLKRKVDLVIGDMPTIVYLARLSQAEPDGAYAVQTMLTIEFLAWGVAPKNAALKAQCDRVLQGWQGDGSLYSMINAWVPASQ
jgi:ABC-type amino acid transport substrate-binding protein